MKFTIKFNDFKKVLMATSISGGVAPISEYVQFSGGFVSAAGIEQFFKCKIDCQGEICIHAKTLQAFIKASNDDIVFDGKKLTCGTTSIAVSTEPVAAFPKLLFEESDSPVYISRPDLSMMKNASSSIIHDTETTNDKFAKMIIAEGAVIHMNYYGFVSIPIVTAGSFEINYEYASKIPDGGYRISMQEKSLVIITEDRDFFYSIPKQDWGNSAESCLKLIKQTCSEEKDFVCEIDKDNLLHELAKSNLFERQVMLSFELEHPAKGILSINGSVFSSTTETGHVLTDAEGGVTIRYLLSGLKFAEQSIRVYNAKRFFSFECDNGFKFYILKVVFQ